jgi:GT2 family glycosyltransferase
MRDVAIVVLNYNGGAVLADCLESARRQTVPVDVVVADNASRDDSFATARTRFPGVRFLAFDRNHGFAGGYNLALAEVPNPWLVLLNNDAFLAPDWVERLLTAAAQRPEAPIWGGKLLLDEPGRTPPRVQRQQFALWPPHGLEDRLKPGQRTPDGLFLRRSLYRLQAVFGHSANCWTRRPGPPTTRAPPSSAP